MRQGAAAGSCCNTQVTVTLRHQECTAVPPAQHQRGCVLCVLPSFTLRRCPRPQAARVVTHRNNSCCLSPASCRNPSLALWIFVSTGLAGAAVAVLMLSVMPSICSSTQPTHNALAHTQAGCRCRTAGCHAWHLLCQLCPLEALSYRSMYAPCATTQLLGRDVGRCTAVLPRTSMGPLLHGLRLTCRRVAVIHLRLLLISSGVSPNRCGCSAALLTALSSSFTCTTCAADTTSGLCWLLYCGRHWVCSERCCPKHTPWQHLTPHSACCLAL